MAAADVSSMPTETTESSAGHPAFRFPPKDELKAVLLDLSKPIAQRMRSIFYLRSLGGDDSVETLCAGASVKRPSVPARFSCVQRTRQPAVVDELTCFVPAALRNKAGTCLFRHEIAYVLGQMQAKSAVPALLEVLKDKEDDPIVRHEVRGITQECRRSELIDLGALIQYDSVGSVWLGTSTQ
jgi:deoxyhypusine monooxygenase